MKKRLIHISFVLSITANIIFGQIYIDYSDIDNNDIVDALAFSGIGIFKFKIDSLEEENNFYLILEEYAGKGNLIKTDTLFGESPFNIESEDINEVRFLTKVENNSFEKVSLFISTPIASTWKEFEMEKKYIRKHFWVKFEESKNEINKNIPLLFLGTEWDSIYNGEKTTRFCALPKIPLDLSGDAFDEIPHFYIISYLVK
jgi:hypothetical protein